MGTPSEVLAVHRGSTIMAECGYLLCNEEATKKIVLYYATYQFCEKHYQQFKEVLGNHDDSASQSVQMNKP